MQNFQLSTNFQQTARWLDRPARLGKQRLETAGSLAMLLGQPSWMSDKQYAYIQKKYANHPAWQMWRGYEKALIAYGLYICEEWVNCGYKDSYMSKMFEFEHMLPGFNGYEHRTVKPTWLTEELASNHRSVILGKVQETKRQAWLELRKAGEDMVDAEPPRKWARAVALEKWYQQFGWTETPAQRNAAGRWPYLWPEVA